MSRFRIWMKLIAFTGGAQILVQSIGFLCGILVIRLLPTQEYALYTLANTMLGTMTLLADGGIATGVMSQGGKVWQDRQKLGAVMTTGMQLRKKFAILSLLVTTPILFYLLHKHDASWLMSMLITISLIPAFYANLSGTLLEIVPKLRQDIFQLQRIHVLANIGRLTLLTLTLFIYPFAAVAIASAGFTQIWSNWRLRKISALHADRTSKEDTKIRVEIQNFVKRTLPAAIYYCISGQIVIWLITIFGTTESLAQVGALGRLALLFNIVNIFFGILVVPRFARASNENKIVLSQYLTIQSIVLILMTIIISLVGILTTEILWILGDNYKGLDKELFIISLASAVGLVSTLAHQLSGSKNIVINPLLLIPSLILSQIVAILFIDVTTVMGVAYYSLMFYISELLIRTTYFIKYYDRTHNSQ